MMGIVSRQQLLSQLMPGLNKLFEEAYAERSQEIGELPWEDESEYTKEVDFGDKPV